jgi:hypothetical protein
LAGNQVSPGRFNPKNASCQANLQFLDSRRVQPLRAAPLPPLQQNNMSRAGGALLGLSQWEGERGAMGGELRILMLDSRRTRCLGFNSIGFSPR